MRPECGKSMRLSFDRKVAGHFAEPGLDALLAQVRELRVRSQTSSAIRALLDLAPKHARLVRDDGSEKDVALEVVALEPRRGPSDVAGRHPRSDI